MAYDIQLTVIIYKKKYYISHLAAIALGDKFCADTMIMFNNRTLIEVKPKDKHLIEEYPVYNMDSVLSSFLAPDKKAEVHKIIKKDCFTFDGMTFISLSKLPIKNKYSLRFSLPAVKIFGTYFILCNKQKDINTRIVIKPE
jgi:hypothetical protein